MGDLVLGNVKEGKWVEGELVMNRVRDWQNSS